MISNTRQLVPSDIMLYVPSEVAVCPYCGAHLSVQIESGVRRDDGTWEAECVAVQCHAEPDVEDESWEAWWQSHCVMPYVYQLPVDLRIRAWISKHFDFDWEAS